MPTTASSARGKSRADRGCRGGSSGGVECNCSRRESGNPYKGKLPTDATLLAEGGGVGGVRCAR